MARDFETTAANNFLLATSAPVTATPLSISAWIKPETLITQTFVFIGHATTGTNSWSIGMSGTKFAQNVQASGVQTNSVGTLVLSAGVWYHLLGVFTSSTSRAFYTNGGDKITSATSRTPAATNRIEIGRFGLPSPSGYADGLIAEVAVWNAALTDAEAVALANRAHSMTIRPGNLVGYWPLYGLVAPEPDLSGGGRPLSTVSGAVLSEDHPPVAPIARPSVWVPFVPDPPVLNLAGKASGWNITPSTATATTESFSTIAGRLYVIFVSSTGASFAAAAKPTVTVSTSETVTEIIANNYDTVADNDQCRVDAFYFVAGSTGSSTVTFTYTAFNFCTGIGWSVVEARNFNPASPIVTSNNLSAAQATGASDRTLTLPNAVAKPENAMVAFLHRQVNELGVVTTGQEIHDINNSSAGTSGGQAIHTAFLKNGNSIAFDWASIAKNGGIAIEIATFSTKTRVSNTITFNYNVKTTVAESQSLNYKIRAIAANIVALNYKIKTSALDNVSLNYKVKAIVADTVALNYKVKARTLDNVALNYRVKARTLDTVTLKYAVAAALYKALDSIALNYRVKAKTSDVISLNYKLKTTVADIATLNYKIKVKGFDNISLNYKVKAKGIDNISLSYKVRARTLDNVSLNYRVRARTLDNVSLSYRVKTVSFDAISLSYRIRIKALDNVSLNYKVRARAFDVISPTYRVRARAVDEISFVWNVLGLGTTGRYLQLRYRVSARAINTVSLAYRVRCIVFDTATLNYKIKLPGADQVQFRYKVYLLGADTATLKYKVRARAFETQVFPYRVKTRAAVSRSLPFKIRTLAPDTLTLRWDVREALSASRSLRYRVKVKAADDLSLQWWVISIAKVFRNLQIRYGITGQVFESLVIRYELHGLSRAVESLTLNYSILAYNYLMTKEHWLQAATSSQAILVSADEMEPAQLISAQISEPELLSAGNVEEPDLISAQDIDQAKLRKVKVE